MVAAAAEKISFPFPYDLAYKHYAGIGDRRNSLGNLPFAKIQSPDPESHLFPIEEELSQSLLSACSQYMDSDGIGLIHSALAMSLSAHQNHYRDSNEPYSTHFLNVALSLAQQLHLDPVTIVSALLHDTLEDTSLKYESIRDSISPEVADTVVTLSGIKGRYQRKAVIDEVNRLKIIKSLIDNPRVAIIKIFDRLHNMQTLEQKKGSAKRIAIIRETQDIYVPLAKRLGLFTQAEELDELCLRKESREKNELADRILVLRDQFQQADPTAQLVGGISQLLSLSPDNVRCRLPGIYDIYRLVGAKRDATADDFYLNIDIVMPGKYQNVRLTGEAPWGKYAMDLENQITWSETYDLSGSVDEIKFKRELQTGAVDSLNFEVKRKKDNLRIRINIFPQDAHEREQISMADMYYIRGPRAFDSNILAEGSEDDITFRHSRALSKQAELRRRLEKALEGYSAGETAPSQLLRYLEPRLPAGFIRVIGVDNEGEELPWVVQAGSTVMDYAKSIFQQDWSKTHQVWINSPDNPVPVNYILQPGDRVHILFAKKNRIHPFWIHAFRTDPDGEDEVRKRIKRIMSKRPLTNQAEWMLQQLFIVSKWRIEQDLDPDNRPLRVGLARAKDIYQGIYPDLTEEDFYLKMGFGEVPEDLIKQVAARLADPNRNVGHFIVTFDQNLSKQALSVLQTVVGVNLLDVSTPTFGAAQAHVELYIDPDDAHLAKIIIRSIFNSPECRSLGLRAVSYKDPKIALFRTVPSSQS